MKHLRVGACLLLLTVASQAVAQDWARQMFRVTTHDFGTVPRGSKQEFAFEFTNLYKEDVHVASVRSSCGCTMPSVTQDTVQTHQASAILAVLNTKAFLGARGGTVTVTIDRPFHAEVQLLVRGFIRGDVMLTPGVADFGSVAAGEGAETRMEIAHTGREDWQILDVRSANEFFEVELDEAVRSRERVQYRMRVRLKPGLAAGYLHDQLSLVTNEVGGQLLPVPVEGLIVSPLSVSPASLSLGALTSGQTVQKRLVVRGNKPFHILGVTCEDHGFQFVPTDQQAKTLHFVTLEYRAGDQPGAIARTIRIETDLGRGLSAECVATVTVKPAS